MSSSVQVIADSLRRARGPRAAQDKPLGLGDTHSARPHRQGGVGTRIQGGIIDDDDQNVLTRGEKWYGSPDSIGISRRMVDDAHVAQSLAIKRAPLVAATWDFEPASQAPIDLEVADFCRMAFFERSNWGKFIGDATLYMRDGFSLIEETDGAQPIPQERFPLHKGRGVGIIPTGFYRLPAWTVDRWSQRKDNPSQLESVEQWILGSDDEEGRRQSVDASRLIRFTQDQEGADFAGNPYLRRVFGPWKIKQTLMIVDAIRHERYGVDVPTLTLPEGATQEDFDVAEAILLELRAYEKGYLALPYGNVFSWTGGSSEGTKIGDAIERQNRDIAFNMGGGFMLLGLSSPGGGGSYALSQSQTGQYEIQLETDADFIAAVINHGSDGWSIVDRIVGLNYEPEVGRPRLRARNMPTRDWSKILPVFHNLTMSGHITPSAKTESFVRDVLAFPQLEAGVSRTKSAPGLPVEMPGPDEVEIDTVDVDADTDADVGVEVEASADEVAPDDTTPKKEQTIFGYHLQNGVVEINEARKNLNLDAKSYGNQTVPEFLARVRAAAPSSGGNESKKETDDADET